MAIDTQAKRGAALGFSSSLAALPFPDGTIDDDDRYVLLGLYPFEADTGESLSTALRFRARVSMVTRRALGL